MSTGLQAQSRSITVERVGVGAHVCLFRPDNWATAIVTEEAAAICSAIFDGEPASRDLAAAEIARRLSEAGFLKPRPARSRVPGDVIPHPPLPAAQVLTCRIGRGPVVALAIEDRVLAQLLASALAPLLVVADEDGICTRLVIRGTGEDFTVERDGHQIAAGLDRAEARRAAIQSLAIAVLSGLGLGAILHASTVAAGNRAIILAGATGSGKSTLALDLVTEGCGYVADDFSPLVSDGRAIACFPLAASIKAGSLPGLAASFPGLELCTEYEIGERRVRYLDLGERAAQRNACPATLLVFPTFSPHAALATTPISPEEALGRLLTTGTEVVGDPRSMRPLANLVNRVPAIVVSYSDGPAAAAAILAEVERS